MTTIPIEVIVQDAENPVGPTPVDPSNPGENTNITVPDTGTGTIDTGSSFTNSSAAISIVSIVIALLAIGAVITLLVRKYNKRKKANIEAGNNTRQEKRAMAVTSTIAVLALTVLLGQLVVAGVVSPLATNAATDNKTDHIDVADKISIVVERAEDSEETVAKVTNVSYVTSTADFGYKVTVAIAADANTANLYLDGNEDSEYYIAPVSNEENGTLADNTWGYTTEEESEDCLPIPLATNPATIVKGYDNVDDEPVDIYYTVQVDKDLPIGTYTGEIEYSIDPAIGYMQDFATLTSEEKSTLLTSMTQDEQYTLKDNRDEKSYYISKLADGNIWMTQNLDHNIVSTPNFYTYANTDIGHGSTLNPSATWTGTATRVTSDTTWTGSTDTPESYDPGDLCWNGTPGSSTTGDCNENNSHYHLGNYYNWTAAVAMSDSSNYAAGNTDVNQSICPAGWTLPKSGNQTESGSFAYLRQQYSSTNMWSDPLYFPLGDTWVGYLSNIGNRGFYWSSVTGGSTISYGLDFFSNGYVNPANNNGRDVGLTVRCVAR